MTQMLLQAIPELACTGRFYPQTQSTEPNKQQTRFQDQEEFKTLHPGVWFLNAMPWNPALTLYETDSLSSRGGLRLYFTK